MIGLAGVVLLAIVLLIILVVLIAVAVFLVITYNGLVKAKNRVKNSFAQIDAQLQRRFDLLPNLVDTVQEFASHEKVLLENVAASREAFVKSELAKDKMKTNAHLNSVLSSLYVVSEKYPDLKSNKHFLQLQEELTETEDKVTFARQFYNDAVTMYNNKLQMFPGNIIGGMFKFEEEELFNVTDEVREMPELFDDDDLTDEEKKRYPQKCPNCMGVPDGTRYCQYCGARLV
ncbi:MAG: LemA family protein [Lachnospiraceae bacterium]|nr:LemA family protein [Lachnospiraceae bacterium]